MPNRHAIDFSGTYDDAMLTHVEPKMQQANREDSNSPWEQAKDRNGVLQWTVSFSATIKNPDSPRTRHENISATMTAAEKPFERLIGNHVIIEGLKLGIMAQARGGFSLFYSIENVRPAHPVQVPARQAASQ